jgi:hypothetical protein
MMVNECVCVDESEENNEGCLGDVLGYEKIIIVDLNWIRSFTWLPKEFIWFEMEMRMARGSHNLLTDHGHQLAVIKLSCLKFLYPRMECAFVERYLYLDWCFDPVTTDWFIHPTILTSLVILIIQDASIQISAKLCINTAPVCPCNILRLKVWMSDDLKEIHKV